MKRGTQKPSKYTLARLQFKNKPRKVLNLEERVQAIRLYEREPIYQRVATTLQCSWEQIKNVIANRRSILHYYVNCQTIADGDDERLVRRKKINFLGNLMHEYIRRAHHYRSAKLNDDVIRDRALEFRDIIAIDKFYPNRAWVNDFKKTYNIDFVCMGNLLITGTPECSLACKDIVEYCHKELDRTLALAMSSGESDEDEFDDVTMVVEATVHRNGGHHTDNDGDDDNEAFNVGDDDDVDDDIEFADDEEGPTIDFGLFEAPQTPFSVPKTAASTKVQCSTTVATNSYESAERVGANKPENTSISPPAVVAVKSSYNQVKLSMSDKAVVDTTATASAHTHKMSSYQEALTWLRPLEILAVCHEDFHAMNLLSQLAQHYEASTLK